MTIGTRVKHSMRGEGIIIALNEDEYGHYSRYRFPYIVRFDQTGYEDVYNDNDVTAI